MTTTSHEQAAFHDAVVRNAVALFTRTEHPAIAEVCELLDCGLVSDIEDPASTTVLIGIGQNAEPGAGLRSFWATPSFKTVTELEAFCAANIEQYRALDLGRDGIPAKWFFET